MIGLPLLAGVAHVKVAEPPLGGVTILVIVVAPGEVNGVTGGIEVGWLPTLLISGEVVLVVIWKV